MGNWTEEEARMADWDYRKTKLTHLPMEKDEPDPGPESDLQTKCQKWLDGWGYPYIHDRSRGKNKSGQILDLHIYLPEGRHVVIELKVAGNPLSPEQKFTFKQIRFLGHEIYEVWSFKQFLEIVNHGTT